MRTYKLLVYEKTGAILLDETITAETDDLAKKQGEAMLEEKEYLDHTHRLASPTGKLILFHS